MIKTISKGYQLTIPAELRNELGMTIGSKVDIEMRDNKLIIKPIEENSIEEMFNRIDRMKPVQVTPAKIVSMKREVYK
ncbi:MAG: AbrB/MazE/SpoVT family DNA-binding domain-containing protein [Candidatus Woesearchaeota archaeon]